MILVEFKQWALDNLSQKNNLHFLINVLVPVKNIYFLCIGFEEINLL